MKIFDCFMYFDEEIVLDLRLNILDKYIDYFVIVESTYTHNGKRRKTLFDTGKFKKFEKKIIHLIFEKEPKEIMRVNDEDTNDEKSKKYILNALYRENAQRNYISMGLNEAEKDDIILISDVDEIPNLESINFKQIENKIILFKQDMFYYKFNLKLPNLIWSGTKACKKKNLESPQWLRNIKDKKYPFYRLDTFFSKKKYTNIQFIENGGWHFSNIKSAKEIEHKLKSYLHHREFEINPLSTKEIENIIKNKQAIYDLKVDKRVNKIGNGSKLEEYSISKLPKYLQNNFKDFKEWME